MTREVGSAVSLLDKYLMFFINFTLFLAFTCVVIIMSWAISEMEPPVDTFFEWLSDIRCQLCFWGSFFLVMSLLGWFGALRENVKCLLWFNRMLMLIILLEFVAILVIFLLVYVPDVTKYVYDEDTYKRAIVRYRDPRYESLKEIVDTMQLEWECCGVSNDDKGYLDWSANQYFNCTDVTKEEVKHDFCSVPYTCCKIRSGDYRNLLCGYGVQHPSVDDATRNAAIYTTGCFKAFVGILKDNIQVIGIIGILIILPEILFYKLAERLKFGIEIQQEKCRSYVASDRLAH